MTNLSGHLLDQGTADNPGFSHCCSFFFSAPQVMQLNQDSRH